MNNDNSNNNKKEEIISINVLMKYIIEVKDYYYDSKRDKWSVLYKNYIRKYYEKAGYKKELDNYRYSFYNERSSSKYYDHNTLNHQYALCLYYAIQNGEVEQSLIDEIREFSIANL